MAIFKTQFFSKSLMQEISVIVTLPLTTVSDYEYNRERLHVNSKYRTLWLLHSGAGDETKILRGSRIEEYAKKHNIAVVMPACANSCGCDLPGMGNYNQFLTYELPTLCRAIYPLSEKEDNFICGFSIGGYASLKIALQNPDKYNAVFSVSGALSLEELLKMENVSFITQAMVQSIYGENNEYYDPHQHDLVTIAKDLLDSNNKIPNTFAISGIDDIYYSCGKIVIDQFQKIGFPITYEESSGGHDWDFWDLSLKRILNWIDTQKCTD